MITEKKILNFALKRGYDYVKKTDTVWKGYQVFKPCFDGVGVAYVGYPLVILVKDNEIRMSTADESLEILDIMYPNDEEDEEIEENYDEMLNFLLSEQNSDEHFSLDVLYGLLNDYYNSPQASSFTELKAYCIRYKDELSVLAWATICEDFDGILKYSILNDVSNYLDNNYALIIPELREEFDKELLKPIIDRIKTYKDNLDKPLTERTYTDFELHMIFELQYENEYFKALTEKEITAYQKLALELSEKSNIDALFAVAFGAYGGNRAFECDFALSEKCFLQLLDKDISMDNKADCANSLGYIYYYGRTNDGVPQYDKAYYYFSFAADCGFTEAQYKLADMYKNGYGTIKCEKLANSIISEMYSKEIKSLVDGEFNNKFADIALRRGNIELEYISTIDKKFRDMLLPQERALRALKYYNEAKYAITKRMELYDYYGDASVAASIDNAIAKAKQYIKSSPRKKSTFQFIEDALRDNIRFEGKFKLTVTKLSDEKYKLIFSRLDDRERIVPNGMLVSIPELDVCTHRTKLCVYAEALSEDEIKCGSYIFDHIEQDNLYYEDKLVFFAGSLGIFSVYR